MFIYADESGHSGKYIFNEPPLYLQGAIFSIDDTEPLFSPIVERYCKQLVVPRLHANELPIKYVIEIAEAFLDALSDKRWVFHITIIEKPYLSITKFVDSIFDSGENKGARWLWYNHQFFRHTLCCLFDDVLTDRNRRNFWTAYLKDDYEEIKNVIVNARTYLPRYAKDKRLYKAAIDGLQYALYHPNDITLMANKSKKSYKGHTPNMVAFSSLIQSAHLFCENYGVVPTAFYHDSQSEFDTTMKEHHKVFGSIQLKKEESGIMARAKRTDYDLGQFAVASSKDIASLQAIDIFLWLYQRKETSGLDEIKAKLSKYADEYIISRTMSEMTKFIWNKKISEKQLTQEDLNKGQATIDKMEKKFLDGLSGKPSIT